MWYFCQKDIFRSLSYARVKAFTERRAGDMRKKKYTEGEGYEKALMS